MIFVDTSAIYALATGSDSRHREARLSFEALLRAKRPLVTHSYVLSEAMALLHHRLGRDVALTFAVEARGLDVEWVDEPLHRAAVDALRAAPASGSLVDQVSFLVMRQRGIGEAFAFNDDFVRAGFRRYATNARPPRSSVTVTASASVGSSTKA